MNILDVYDLQVKYYGDVLKAFNSLDNKGKKYIKQNFPELLPSNTAKRKYFNTCWAITESNKHLIPEIEKRRFREFDIDHIISVHYGYKNKISAELIGSIDNLRVIAHTDNAKKSVRLTTEGKLLLKRWEIE